MRTKKTPTRAEKRAEAAWISGHMRAAAVSIDALAHRWEKALGPRHHLVVGLRELAADARWVARSPNQDAVIVLADRIDAIERELGKLRSQGRAAIRRSRAAAAAKTRKRKTTAPARLRLLRG